LIYLDKYCDLAYNLVVLIGKRQDLGKEIKTHVEKSLFYSMATIIIHGIGSSVVIDSTFQM